MAKIFVTGADGMLGSNLVRELLGREYQVKAFILEGKSSPTLEGLPIEYAEGNLLDKHSVLAGMEGCDYAIHVAAVTSVWPSKGSIYHRVNVEGTENIIEAALETKIKRLIHVGSASSFGFGHQHEPGNEETPYKSGKYGLDYIDTKREGQFRVEKAVRERGLDAVIVNPTFMIGPYDSQPNAGKVILGVYEKQTPGYSPGGKNWVYVKDVAVGIANAIEKGKTGESYILGHENLSFKEAFKIIAEVVDRPFPSFAAPAPLVKLAGRFGSLASSITGKAPTVSYKMAWISCDGHYFSPKKAVEELDLPQTPIRVAIKEAFDWFKENGYLKS
ncbi:MAG: NAD-dependent epimerase/dehydratase family protein [Bacteroidia bacterium]|nr:NAD-dependent epimerase/dehydratase family protein [Bacteroidia bacterium]